tara:strand:+ start:1106 stop:2002 length:897 start_codon:yes stop_codon:yes gene_type:complete
MTNDVEEVSIVNNNLNSVIAKKVSNVGIPRLINIYSKYDVSATFYFTGTFANTYPESVHNVLDHGHEVGCHGYSHSPHHYFDKLSVKQQLTHLSKAKEKIESIAGKIEAFRAPALRIGDHTPQILEKLGFKTDSSVAPMRFDGPLTSGGLRKLNWLTCPRDPYYMSLKNPYKRGASSVLEIPVSSYFAGYQGTTMRIAPKLNNLVENKLYSDSRKNRRPIVFLFHPTELVTEVRVAKSLRRSKSYMGYLFSDLIRQKLKLQNIGKKSLPLLENVLKKAKKESHQFVSAREFRLNFKKC